MRQLRADGQAVFSEAGWRLTAAGIQAARQDAHNEALWDMYRLHAQELELPVLQEDRQIAIAALLPDSAIARLERKLRAAEQRR